MGEKNRREERLRFDLERLPRWFVIELEEAGIPLVFKESELTEHQMRTLEVITAALQLIHLGLIEVTYVKGVVCYHIPGSDEENFRRAIENHRRLGGKTL